MPYPCLAQCPTPWKQRSLLLRCATTHGVFRFFLLGMPDILSLSLRKTFDPRRSQLRKFLLFVALACSIRVTSAITWIFLFGRLLWQLRQKPALLRAFIADTISTVYVYECLFYTLFTHVLWQVCGVWHALRTRQRVQRHADTHRAHLSPCQRFVCLTLLRLRTLALLSHSGPPAASRALSAIRSAWCLHCFHSRSATPQAFALYCVVDECNIFMCGAQGMAFPAPACTHDTPSCRTVSRLTIRSRESPL